MADPTRARANDRSSSSSATPTSSACPRCCARAQAPRTPAAAATEPRRRGAAATEPRTRAAAAKEPRRATVNSGCARRREGCCVAPVDSEPPARPPGRARSRERAAAGPPGAESAGGATPGRRRGWTRSRHPEREAAEAADTSPRPRSHALRRAPRQRPCGRSAPAACRPSRPAHRGSARTCDDRGERRCWAPRSRGRSPRDRSSTPCGTRPLRGYTSNSRPNNRRHHRSSGRRRPPARHKRAPGPPRTRPAPNKQHIPGCRREPRNRC